jgi:hypothetical protein
VVANVSEGDVVPRYAPNKMPAAVKKRYFELIRTGMKRSGFGPAGRRVDQLRLAVVPPRWRRDHHRPIE